MASAGQTIEASAIADERRFGFIASLPFDVGCEHRPTIRMKASDIARSKMQNWKMRLYYF